jgi:hypothetical protein
LEQKLFLRSACFRHMAEMRVVELRPTPIAPGIFYPSAATDRRTAKTEILREIPASAVL